MKQIIYSVLLCVPQILFSQDPYSTTTIAEDFLSLHVNAIEFNGKHYVICEEYCSSFFNPGCIIISEVLPNGTLNKVSEVEDLQVRSNAVTADSNVLTVIGKSQHDSIVIIQFDTDLNEIKRKSFYQENHIWTFGIIEFDSYLVFSTRNFSSGPGPFQGFLFWVSKSDLTMVETLEGGVFSELSMVRMKIDNDNLLNIFSLKEDSSYILQFDQSRNLAGVIHTPTAEFIQAANFEILSNQDIVYGLEANEFLICVNADGELRWKINLASHFEVPSIEFIEEIVEAANGDILICGSMYSSRNAFIVRISNSGQVLWSRTYEVENAKESFLFEIIETIDSNILFAGSMKMVEPSETSAHDHYWMLLTDPDGCIDTTCVLVIDFDGDGFASDVDCNDLNPDINPGQVEIPNNLIDENCDGIDGTTHLNLTSGFQFTLFPNPTTRFMNVASPGNNLHAQFKIMDMTGMSLLNGVVDTKIDLGPLSPGMYFLHIQDDVSKMIFTSKIVKVE